MDFDTAKENIQPLASGRNAEQLETALHAESDHEIQEKLHEQRREFEKAIETYDGDDPLQPWYDYIVWIEQVYPKSGKESALHELLSKCLALFEKDERYFQDRRMLKLYIKYIDSEPNPPQFYEQLYNNGIGTMIADLYLCWAHYYDYCDNFEKAESVYRKGLDARAQPIELLEQAHRQFGFSMSQRILYKDESTQKEFRSTMDEQRLALTSLRAHKHRHVGSIRTGSAVKSHNPGRVDQHGSSSRHHQKENRKVQVFEDNGEEAAAPTSPIASTSVVQSIINSTKKQENMREPGPWNKAKIKSHALFAGGSSSKPSFSILEDDDIPLPDSENNYARGIQLPKDFVRKNVPQEEFTFPLHRDEDPVKNTLWKYDKFMVFPAPDKCYSLEELAAYNWYKKRNIRNNFTRTQDAVWANGYNIPIRIPPHFARKNRKQDDWDVPPITYEDALANGQRKFGFNIDLIYTPTEEYSPEEILQSKWINGDLMSQKDAEMDITCGFDRREDVYIRNAKRRSMAIGGRKSILPRRSESPRRSISARKSIAPTEPASVAVQQGQEKQQQQQQQQPSTSDADVATGAVKKTSLPKRKSVYMSRALDTLTTIPETASPPISRRKLNEDEELDESHHKPNPIKFSIFEDNDRKETENDDNLFKVPQIIQKPGTSSTSVFHDEDLDGCTTQTFNFFIKSQSISTPKVAKPSAKLMEPESFVAKGLDFGNDSDASPSDDHNDDAGKQPFGLRCADVDQQYTLAEQHDMYRQKLSAIMETTEECATASTVSSLAATASTKSSVEDFEFTKHSNQQSSVAMSTYRHQTIVNNTAKMSSSNVSGMHRENESRKASTLGFEIYQEDAPKTDDTMASQAQENITKNADLSKPFVVQSDNFDKTLPPAGQFHIYEDDTEEQPQPAEIQPPKKEASMVVKETEVSKCPDRSVFEISQTETAPSNWNSKTITNDMSSTRRVSSVPQAETQQNLTLTTPAIPTQTQSKSAFQLMRDDTGMTIPAINFVEDRTEQVPPFFNGNQTNFTQQIPPAFEAPSIYMPEIPDDTMKNMSKLFKANASLIEPPPAMPDQSAVYNRSVFLFPKEDTTNVFTSNFAMEKTETAPKLPNPMQMSMISGNLSAFPMIPEMPTLPEIDFAAEASRNASMINKSQAINRTKAETTLKVDKSLADQSTFYGFREDTDLAANKSNMAANKSTVGRKTLVESNANEVSEINLSKQVDKTLTTSPIIEPKEAQNKSVFVVQEEEKENNKMENVPAMNFNGNKSMANKSKANIDEELYALINSPPKLVEQPPSPVTAEKSLFGMKSFVIEKMEKSRTAIDEEIYAIISPPSQNSPEVESAAATNDGNKSIFSRSKPSIDDEFYAMIKSPITKKDNTLQKPILILDTTPSPVVPQPIRESIVPERKTVHQISILQNPSTSLLEPMKQTSVRESLTQDSKNIRSLQRNSSVEVARAFSEDNPNTAMFSIHMPSIKNSTILHNSKDNINEITDELKTSLVINNEKSMNIIPEESIKQNESKLPNVTAEGKFVVDELATNITTDFKVNSIHIKEERFSIPNKTVVSEKPRTNIDDEIYDCIKEKDSVANGFLDLSIELTEAEMAELKTESMPKPMNFLISNPVSIRPSQFPMNDTIAKNESRSVEKSLKELHQSSSKMESVATVKPEDTSLIVVEDTEDLSAVCKSAANKSRRETVHSPFKNRYALNPKLNETISAVKDIDPFDIHLQNAFLDDIDFIEYIRSLEYVNITTRVGAIELNTQLEMGSETFDIVKQIGKGSFGFVYSGKNTKTGKMYAFKQERPANHWEFYISLEIASRIEDPKMLPGFMSVNYAMVGHNSSIFASEFCEYGSLFNVCNHHKLNTCRNLDEVIVMIFSEQMLSILDHLHASNIIHGDIKPDNFLLMKRLTYGSNDLVIKLIDYGRSIDLNFFPPNQTFTSTLNTKNFICTEMLENRPWKHQVDLFCMASTMYTLVCGKYMNVEKHDSLIRPYVLSEKLPPYVDVALWEHILYTLINVRDHNALPDLQKLRLRIRESIVEKESIIEDRITKFNAVLDNKF